MEAWIAGPLAGFLATTVMTILEVPAWRRRGFRGILDWEQIQPRAARLVGRPAEDLVGAGLCLHFSHGVLAGLVFALSLTASPVPFPSPAAGAAFGIVLWALTLAVHARVTGRRIRGDSVRIAAAMVSLGSHLVYGIALGGLVLLLCKV